jgi:hypothetical protein
VSEDKLSWRQELSRKARQLWAIPRLIAGSGRERQRQKLLAELEAERLDRIRNPSKYLGR